MVFNSSVFLKALQRFKRPITYKVVKSSSKHCLVPADPYIHRLNKYNIGIEGVQDLLSADPDHNVFSKALLRRAGHGR